MFLKPPRLHRGDHAEDVDHVKVDFCIYPELPGGYDEKNSNMCDCVTTSADKLCYKNIKQSSHMWLELRIRLWTSLLPTS